VAKKISGKNKINELFKKLISFKKRSKLTCCTNKVKFVGDKGAPKRKVPKVLE
jgi:hypothetical protein